MYEEILVFRSGESFFGIDEKIVKEVVLVSETNFMQIPRVPEVIAGILYQNSELIPVINFQRRLNPKYSGGLEFSVTTNVLVLEYKGNLFGIFINELPTKTKVDKSMKLKKPSKFKEVIAEVLTVDTLEVQMLDTENFLVKLDGNILEVF